MRSIIVAFIVAALSVLADPGWTASQRDYDDCNQTKDMNQRIAGCTRVIDDRKEPAGNRAKAYYRRGVGWYVKGDSDRAVADLSEAIRLDPKFTAAYNDRALVFQERRDYVRSIGDRRRYGGGTHYDAVRCRTLQRNVLAVFREVVGGHTQ